MSIFAIGDLHLSFGTDKPMDIFSGWGGYVEQIEENWKKNIDEGDTVVLAGDTSWGMGMEQSIPDFRFIDSLPGNKLVLKGNHDYWWSSLTSMKKTLEDAGIASIDFINNNSFVVENIAICGSRGWLFEKGQLHDQKIINREAIRIQISLQSVKDESLEKILFLHYPPLFGEDVQMEYIELMKKHGVKRCYYGHIHDKGHYQALQGNYYGIDFKMISADYLKFNPAKIV